MAITSDSLEKNPNLWNEVDRGDYQIVYACPEQLVKHKGHFSQTTLKSPKCAFMKNLVAVAIDECHLIWEWEGFRVGYRYIGNIRAALVGVPFVCLSATLTPNVAAYIHEVCSLQARTIRFRISIRRNNINVVVAPVDGNDIQPLLDLIPPRIQDLLQIPKTLIFHDDIDNAQLIFEALRRRLPPAVSGVPSNTIVRLFYGSIDEGMKTQSLSDIISGRTRITVCTDAFGVGVNVKDITRVIQWHVDFKLAVASLYQRIGRAARNPSLLGTAIIYVNKKVLESISPDWNSAWNDPNPPAIPVLSDDDLRVIPVSKRRELPKFSLPVQADTLDKVNIHVSNLYIAAKSLKEAHSQAKRAGTGTIDDKCSAAEKLDPSVLWVISTTGCRLRVFLSIFRDTDTMTDAHTSWCCDSCALRDGVDGITVSAAGLPLQASISFLRPASHSGKILLIGKAKPLASDRLHEEKRTAICAERRDALRRMLCKWRQMAFRTFELPSTTPARFILPDTVIDSIVKHIGRIVTIEQLRRELNAIQFDLESSVLQDQHVSFLLHCINESLERTLPMESKSASQGNYGIISRLTVVAATRNSAASRNGPGKRRPLPNLGIIEYLLTGNKSERVSASSDSGSERSNPPELQRRVSATSSSSALVVPDPSPGTLLGAALPLPSAAGPIRRQRNALQTITNIHESRRADTGKRVLQLSKRLQD